MKRFLVFDWRFAIGLTVLGNMVALSATLPPISGGSPTALSSSQATVMVDTNGVLASPAPPVFRRANQFLTSVEIGSAALGHSLELERAPLGSMDRAKMAIAQGTLRLVFVGDSITEGAVVDSEDTYPVKVRRKLEALLPGVTILYSNFALGGRTAPQLNDTNYTAANPEITGHFWRSWSTAGKSWIDHVRDAQPDLLIYAFGMNDSGGHNAGIAQYFSDNLNAFYTSTLAWTNPPSLVIVPTILPTTNTNYYSQRQDMTLSVSMAAREYARVHGLAIADAGRLWSIYRDGADYCRSVGTNDTGFASYPAGWSHGTNSWTCDSSGNMVATGNASAQREISFLDGEITGWFTFPTSGFAGSMVVYYRISELNSSALVVTPGDNYTGNVAFYYGTNVIAGALATIPISGAWIRVVAKGRQHQAFVNGSLALTVNDFHTLVPGAVAFQAVGLPSTIQGTSIIVDAPTSWPPPFTEVNLLGAYNANTGAGINHPSSFGHQVAYVRAFEEIFRELQHPSPRIQNMNMAASARVEMNNWVAHSNATVGIRFGTSGGYGLELSSGGSSASDLQAAIIENHYDGPIRLKTLGVERARVDGAGLTTGALVVTNLTPLNLVYADGDKYLRSASVVSATGTNMMVAGKISAYSGTFSNSLQTALHLVGDLVATNTIQTLTNRATMVEAGAVSITNGLQAASILSSTGQVSVLRSGSLSITNDLQAGVYKSPTGLSGINVSIPVLIAGGSTNLLVYSGGILVSNVASYTGP